MAAAASCSSLSSSLAEPLWATAPEARAWFLIEQPKPWGAKALRESGLDSRVGAELERRAKDLGVKVLVVKRPGLRGRSAGRVFGCSTVPGAERLEELPIESQDALLELDLDALARGESLGGGPVEHPLYLVCTNGKRDACCARVGAGVARALDGIRPGQVWECSHLGGHRFAANLVCLPHGLCYGRVRADSAGSILAAYEAGHVELDALRGRSRLTPAQQAAEYLVRDGLGLTGIADVVPGNALLADHGATVAVTAAGVDYRVELRSEPAEEGRPFSCGDDKLERPVVWSLVSLRQKMPARARPSG
jgi:hypothetical protein